MQKIFLLLAISASIALFSCKKEEEKKYNCYLQLALIESDLTEAEKNAWLAEPSRQSCVASSACFCTEAN